MRQPFDWSFPYPSQRMPVLAGDCIATSQPLAAQAGLHMLRRGGNAVDAAIAAAAALTVVEPTSNGIGADNFALIWAGGGLHGLNASGRCPAAFDVSRYAGQDRLPYYGWHGVTTPGAVSGWVEASNKFGALPFAELLQPAIHYARDGFLVSPLTADSWRRAVSHYAGPEFASWRQTFAPGGDGPAPGAHVTLPDHAKTLEAIAATKDQAFYHGELAAKIDAASRAAGGALRASDLAAHTPQWVRPIHTEYRGYRLNEIPPNGQGIVALIALGILRNFDIAALGPDEPAKLHLEIEAMKLAFRDGHKYIADPEYMTVDAAELLSEDYLASRAALIDRKHAQDFQHGRPKSGGTVYLTAADRQGNMVSFIQSNYTGFGSGIVIPGTGIALQNRACCFTLEEGHANVAAPGKRPYHTIIPGFVTRIDSHGDEQPVMSFGVMGGFMQPQGHAQVMVRIADFGQNPQAALDAPRWQVGDALDVNVEPGFDEAVYEKLAALGHSVQRAEARTVAHGRGQIIWKLEDGYLAASDARSDGQAVGF